MIIDWGETGGSATEEEDGTVTVERNFWAKASHGRMTELEVGASGLFPRRGDLHPTRPDLRCTSAIVTRRKPGNRLFDVQATYSNKFERPQEDNPLARPAIIRMRTIFYEIPSLIDARGRLVTNTAGDPFDGFVRRVAGRVFTISKNLATWPEWTSAYAMAMNADTVRIRGRSYARHTLRMGSAGIEDEQFENDVRYFPATFELEWNPLTWVQQFWNRGMNELVRGFERERDGEVRFAAETFDDEGNVRLPPFEDARPATRLRRILIGEDEDEVPAEPQWLDERGRWIPGRPEPSEAIRLDFHDLNELPFAVLPLS